MTIHQPLNSNKSAPLVSVSAHSESLFSSSQLPTIEAKNLHLDVKLVNGSSCVLRDIDFRLYASKTLGLVGESGAGKSMLGRIISRQLPTNFTVRSGQLMFGDLDLLLMSDEEHRQLLGQRIAFIPQEPMTALNPVLTIGQQFTEHLVRIGIPLDKCNNTIIDSFNDVMLTNPQSILDKYSFQLSGGMCQRILIAMAFSSKPELVIADEATTALDPTSQAQVVRLLKKLQQKEGTAVLFVTHDMGLATHVCDDVAVLYAGEIMEKMQAKALFDSPSHPYTQALKAATPALTGELLRLQSLDGQMPGVESFSELKGCRFSSRCKLSTAECTTAVPKLLKIGSQHSVRCIKTGHIDSLSSIQSTNSNQTNLSIPVGLVTEETKAVHQTGKAFSHSPILTVNNLTKIFHSKTNQEPTTPAVSEVNLSIAAGEFIGIVGGSGSGKSTLAKLIMGLETPSSGVIQLNGKNIEADKKSWRKRISLIQMIFQDARSALNPNRKVEKLLTQAMDKSPFRKSVRKKRASELAIDVGLSELALQRYPTQLSGGQRQRVNIGRSLCDVPQILIADEIVSGLDVSVQANIMNLLLELRQEHKFALLLISHDLSVVRYLCDKIVVMHKGVFVEHGDTQQILANPQHPYTKELIASIPPTDWTKTWPSVGADSA
ncbi:ABC transporter ATP-binding protein [Paraglaciecola sp. L3A3]|uniref:ABC transporter ATP-binding protein n=1 Tax=Paraglaciecola sp. L3A3 TaxID=2686358 RepID=UPI00131DF1C1|nr:ABC transporter ATP-binding protein [Paraglaciecola sp. L3A3]